MQKKITVGVIFGGRSGEHEVSLVSAQSVMNALDKEKYEIVPIGITKQGKWLVGNNLMNALKSSQSLEKIPEKILTPDPTNASLIPLENSKLRNTELASNKIDVVFPVLHGTYGEDGAMQGLLELTNIPYVGAGILGSSVGMDKIIQKNLFQEAGLQVIDYIWFKKLDWVLDENKIVEKAEKELGYPMFIKPANMGSSVGISKAHNQKELVAGIKEALDYDRKVVIEKSVEKAREIECAVLGNDEPKASVCGEVLPDEEFYSYNSKYAGESKTIIPADLPEKISDEIRNQAIKVFQILDCAGMGRVDFFVKSDLSKIYINEINTIPGFTSISMYPKLWEKTGLNYSELLDKLIELAMERNKEKKELKTSFEEAGEWHKK